MTTPIGAATATQPQTGDSMLEALGGMGSGGFMKLMIAQLQYQNPMEPTDTNEMMAQTATLAQVDSMQQLVQAQQRDLGLQQAVMAAGMLGNEITATDADGLAVVGVVEGVRYTTDGPVLTVGDSEVRLDAISEIRSVDSGSGTETA